MCKSHVIVNGKMVEGRTCEVCGKSFFFGGKFIRSGLFYPDPGVDLCWLVCGNCLEELSEELAKKLYFGSNEKFLRALVNYINLCQRV